MCAWALALTILNGRNCSFSVRLRVHTRWSAPTTTLHSCIWVGCLRLQSLSLVGVCVNVRIAPNRGIIENNMPARRIEHNAIVCKPTAENLRLMHTFDVTNDMTSDRTAHCLWHRRFTTFYELLLPSIVHGHMNDGNRCLNSTTEKSIALSLLYGKSLRLLSADRRCRCRKPHQMRKHAALFSLNRTVRYGEGLPAFAARALICSIMCVAITSQIMHGKYTPARTLWQY